MGNYFKGKAVFSILRDGQVLYSNLKGAYDRYERKNSWTVTVGDTDGAFFLVKHWVMPQIGDARHPTVVSTRRDANGNSSRKVFFPPADRESSTILLDGHRIKIKFAATKKPGDRGEPLALEAAEDDYGDPFRSSNSSDTQALVFLCNSKPAFEAVKAKIVDLYDRSWDSSLSPSRLFLWSSSYWTAKGDLLIERSLESVVLARGQMERITDDLAHFISSEQKYNDRGVPWHRGYILHGPPGTGKTSVVRALASAHNMDLYYLSLSDVLSDSALMDAVSQIGKRSMLVIEDVDISLSAVDRNAPSINKGVSLSSLLNVLDGIITPHGLITFVTTNLIDRLDSALIRKGRMDVSEKVGFPTDDQIERLWAVFFPGEPALQVSLPADDVRPTAYFYDILKRHMEDPASARAEIASYCAGTLDEDPDAEILEELLAVPETVEDDEEGRSVTSPRRLISLQAVRSMPGMRPGRR